MNALVRSDIFLVWTLVAALSAGCASNVTLTIQTQPEGAYVTEVGTGKALGIAPVQVSYDSQQLLRYKDANGCVC